MEIVSIIMPCYNDGAYIEEAVASVRAQTYENIELIVIDDGSDDKNTLSVLEKLREQGVKLLHTDHLRPAGARNAGIAAATGKYILPLDSDDAIEPVYVAQAVAEIEKDDNIGIVYCHADLFGEQSGPWQLKDFSIENMLLDNVIFVTALFRREDWVKVGGFRSSMQYGSEDYDFWLSILELGREVRQLPDILFHYRIKPVSRTSLHLDDPETLRETYHDIYRNHPDLYERYRHEYAIALRNEVIRLRTLLRTYQKAMGVLYKLKNIPWIRNVVRKITSK